MKISKLIMNISTMLSVLKVIKEVMKLLNEIEVHTYVYVHYHYTHTIFIAILLCSDYAGILEYPVSLPLAYQQLVYLCNVHTINAMIDTSPVNEYSSLKLKIY